ncbi:atos homolog protein B [Neoarius graeffei]|uniref:atos homolog protein B n=1 Tax=Neoarius graeffei TaxID=443677 RepID=UPI00298C2398|nr:atos homolog protein B [Neoarius graeffei]XP_060763711.1 atos homolog protein B [Neoarius graeffei]XP_060763713.1 atos homolog protein B [Neoarius graeffei]
MRHLHVELVRKEARAGDLPPPSDPQVTFDPQPRPLNQEELRLQKVYQLSIFSQRGGFKSSMKRGLEETSDPVVAPKRLLQDEDEDEDDDEEMEGEVLCGRGSTPLLPPLPAKDAFAPLSPKSPPMVDPHTPPTAPLEPSQSSHPPLTPAEVIGWGAELEKTPPPSERQPHPPSPPSCSNGSSSSERSGEVKKKKLLSFSDVGDSCSEDEGPSTSKRCRLALTPGIGLAPGRSTDSKAAPYWTHLLPTTREQGKSLAECSRSSRRLKTSARLKSRQLRSGRRTDTSRSSSCSSLAVSRSLLGNFEESILKGRFPPSGRIEGFTAEIGASGSYCPKHATLPVQVTYYDTSEHSAPSPFLGVISLEPLGKKGYSVPKAGTIQVTLFNPNKTVVKMFLVTYNFGDMPVNHMTFLRHRIFLVPVEEGVESGAGTESSASDRKKILCYLIHLRFQSSKSGKIYLHNDIRLLFSRKSIEVDTGIPYELKSFTEVPRNPKYSPRV